MKIYWKQFVAWVTDLRNRYSHDIFFRTEWNVIGLQIIFAIVLTLMVAVTFNYLYKDILNTLVTGILQSLKIHGSIDATSILNSVGVVRAKNFISFLIATVIVTLIFSFIIAKITLTPVRRSLSSQKRFIADIAHELRTPLSVIRTHSEVALLNDSMAKEVRKIFISSIEELDRTSGIINNLLTFNNLIRPEKMEFSTINLIDAAEQSIKKVEKLAKGKNISLSLQKTLPATVWGNPAAIDQIILNLVKNAVNYTDPGGKVSIQISPDYRGYVNLVVTDTGRGIAPKDLRHIFEPFFRAEPSRDRKSGSSGLGLTIVSELVKSHNGKIQVKSKVQVGTIITISLPYKAVYKITENSSTHEQVSVDFSG